MAHYLYLYSSYLNPECLERSSLLPWYSQRGDGNESSSGDGNGDEDGNGDGNEDGIEEGGGEAKKRKQ